MELISVITQVAIVGLLFLLINTLKKTPEGIVNYIKEARLEDKRTVNESNLQREAYFREISGAEIERTFELWTSLLTNMTSKADELSSEEGVNTLREMNTKALMYGSERTIKILAEAYQYTYSIENKETTLKGNIILLFYIANLISSLKYDFTGYNVPARDIIDILINDSRTKNVDLFNEIEELVNERLEEIS